MSKRLYLPNRPARGVICAFTPCDRMTQLELMFPLVKGAPLELWRYGCADHLPKCELGLEDTTDILNWMILLGRSPDWYRRYQPPLGHGAVVSIDRDTYLLVATCEITEKNKKYFKELRNAITISDEFKAVKLPYTYATKEKSDET